MLTLKMIIRIFFTFSGQEAYHFSSLQGTLQASFCEQFQTSHLKQPKRGGVTYPRVDRGIARFVVLCSSFIENEATRVLLLPLTIFGVSLTGFKHSLYSYIQGQKRHQWPFHTSRQYQNCPNKIKGQIFPSQIPSVPNLFIRLPNIYSLPKDSTSNLHDLFKVVLKFQNPRVLQENTIFACQVH